MKSEKRRYCEHCDEYVSVRSYFRHKDYQKATEKIDDSAWSSNSETEEQSETGE